MNQLCYNSVIPKGSLLSSLGSLQLELGGWRRVSGRQKEMAPRQIWVPGSALKDYLLKNDSSPCPLQSQICHFSRGLEGPISPLPHRKRQNSRKITSQGKLLYTTTSCLGQNILALAKAHCWRNRVGTRAYTAPRTYLQTIPPGLSLRIQGTSLALLSYGLSKRGCARKYVTRDKMASQKQGSRARGASFRMRWFYNVFANDKHLTEIQMRWIWKFIFSDFHHHTELLSSNTRRVLCKWKPSTNTAGNGPRSETLFTHPLTLGKMEFFARMFCPNTHILKKKKKVP